jgi:hypothetical protein
LFAKNNNNKKHLTPLNVEFSIKFSFSLYYNKESIRNVFFIITSIDFLGIQ